MGPSARRSFTRLIGRGWFLPGPAAGDLQFQRETEERADQHDQGQHQHAGHAGCHRDDPDDVGRHQQLKPQQDRAAQLLTETSVRARAACTAGACRLHRRSVPPAPPERAACTAGACRLHCRSVPLAPPERAACTAGACRLHRRSVPPAPPERAACTAGACRLHRRSVPPAPPERAACTAGACRLHRRDHRAQDRDTGRVDGLADALNHGPERHGIPSTQLHARPRARSIHTRPRTAALALRHFVSDAWSYPDECIGEVRCPWPWRVPTGGQVEVPGGGRVEVPRSSLVVSTRSVKP